MGWVFYFTLYFLFIIKSNPKSVLLASISFLNIPFLKKLRIMTIDSKKREIIENNRMMKLLVTVLLFLVEDFLISFFFILIRSVMC